MRKISLNTPLLKSIVRHNSYKIVDNAPKISDNEGWLESLKWKNAMDLDETPQLSESANEYVSGTGQFPITVVSTPPESHYIDIKAPIINFTSMKYLQEFNKHKHAQGNFIDVRIVKCRSGKGGDGSISFFRDAGRSIGPPDGGDGGDGGSIFLQAVESLDSLAKIKTTYVAGDGEDGAAAQLDGPTGNDILIKVPKGTIVHWCMDPRNVRSYIQKELQKEPTSTLRSVLENNMLSLKCISKYRYDTEPTHIQLFRDSYESGAGWLFKGKSEEYHLDKDWFVDLNKKVTMYDDSLRSMELKSDTIPLYGIDLDHVSNTPICLLKGGKGGLGNMHFLTNIIRNPRFSKMGRNGLEQYFMFELKSIADLGLIGFPNAGKSTILGKISNAKPRVGHWEFTTLSPSIGTVSLGIDSGS